MAPPTAAFIAPFSTVEGSAVLVVWLAADVSTLEASVLVSVSASVVVAASDVFSAVVRVVVAMASDDVSEDLGSLIPQAASASNVKGRFQATQPSPDLWICSVRLISHRSIEELAGVGLTWQNVGGAALCNTAQEFLSHVIQGAHTSLVILIALVGEVLEEAAVLQKCTLER